MSTHQQIDLSSFQPSSGGGSMQFMTLFLFLKIKNNINLIEKNQFKVKQNSKQVRFCIETCFFINNKLLIFMVFT
jgi:hypothetical protein